jgi:hyaluronan synthase
MVSVAATVTTDEVTTEAESPWDVPNEGRLHQSVRWVAALVTAALCGLLILHIVGLLRGTGLGTIAGIYTMVLACYIFSRFVLAAIYKPPRDAGLEPTIAIVVPAFNEGNAVVRTIDSCCTIAYPPEKVEVVAINDGSTDDTWEQMNLAAARYPGRVTCIDLGYNQGKRAAMAAGIRATDAEILVFVDSDSMPAPWAVRKLVQGFADSKVGAVSGLTYLRNANTNVLTHMQAASYYVSFQLLKAAESVVNAVSCASGCFAAYRRSAVMPILEQWEHQTLFGRPWLHGDDRALTNMVLRRWKVIYDSEAEVWTEAPERYRQFFKQQLRWQKSFVGESLVLVRHSWRSHPLAFPAILIGAIAGLASPLVTLYQVGWQPIANGTAPVVYLLGLYVMNTSYALLYRSLRNDGVWKYAVVSAFFYVGFSFQVFWAVIRIHDNSWGTRGMAPPAGSTAEPPADLRAAPSPLPATQAAGLVPALLEEHPSAAAAPVLAFEAAEIRGASGTERRGKAARSRSGLHDAKRARRKRLLLATSPAVIAVAVAVSVIATRPTTTASLRASGGQESNPLLVPASPVAPDSSPSRPHSEKPNRPAPRAKAPAASAPKPKGGQGARARADHAVAGHSVSDSGTRVRVPAISRQVVSVGAVHVRTPSDSSAGRSTVPAVHGGGPVGSAPSTSGAPVRAGGGTSGGGAPGAGGQHRNPSRGSGGSHSGGGTGVSGASGGGQGTGTSSGGGSGVSVTTAGGQGSGVSSGGG